MYRSTIARLLSLTSVKSRSSASAAGTAAPRPSTAARPARIAVRIQRRRMLVSSLGPSAMTHRHDTAPVPDGDTRGA